MWYLKNCPRCRGNIFIDEDVGGRFEKCLQCGYEREILNTSPVNKSQSGKKEKPVFLKAV
jgi:DNA-directed RNA polymerase subunit M/transcription elongation factor TFIIS